MRNFTVGRIWGIPIRLNISLVVFVPLLAWLIGNGGQIEVYAGVIEGFTGVGFDVARLRAGSTPWVIGTLAAVGLFVSVTLHELGHSWVALRYGLDIESITLWILGGIAALSSIPREWNREFWIAIAGPITSFLVAGGFYGATVLTPGSLPVVRFVFGWLAVTNVVLAVFNLLPAFPMDGGRILRALLARSRPYGSATRTAARIGVAFAVLFAVVGVLNFELIMILLAFFIYGAATTESRVVMLDELLDGLTVADVMTREPQVVDGDTTVAAFVDRMIRDRQTVYPVRGEDGAIAGVVALEDLKAVAGGDREATTVRSLVHDVPRVGAADDAFDTLAALGQRDGSVALVETDGRIVGVLSQSDYTHALTMQREFGTKVAQ